MKKRAATLLFLVLAARAVPASAKEAYTDDAIRRYFEKNGQVRETHGLMAAQSDRLDSILHFFLVGDSEQIAKHASEISEIMRTVVLKNAPSAPDEEAKIWKALSEVVLQARLLEAEANRKDYHKAYEHFTLLTAQCIECHQVARAWGKFQEPVVEAEKPKVEKGAAGS